MSPAGVLQPASAQLDAVALEPAVVGFSPTTLTRFGLSTSTSSFMATRSGSSPPVTVSFTSGWARNFSPGMAAMAPITAPKPPVNNFKKDWRFSGVWCSAIGCRSRILPRVTSRCQRPLGIFFVEVRRLPSYPPRRFQAAISRRQRSCDHTRAHHQKFAPASSSPIWCNYLRGWLRLPCVSKCSSRRRACAGWSRRAVTANASVRNATGRPMPPNQANSTGCSAARSSSSRRPSVGTGAPPAASQPAAHRHRQPHLENREQEHRGTVHVPART